MSDDIFAEMAAQMKPADEVLDALNSKLEGTEAQPESKSESKTKAGSRVSGGSRPRRRYTGWIAAAACLAALGIGTLLPGAVENLRSMELADPFRPEIVPTEVAAPEAIDPSEGLPSPRPTVPPPPPGTPVAGYEKLFAAVWQASQYGDESSGNFSWGSRQVVMEDRAAAPAPAAGSANGGSVKAGGYQTNVQVADIDEGDIVKSDGETIYVSHDKQVVVLAAAGVGTKQLTRIDTSTGQAADTTAVKGELVVQGPIADMMLFGKTLVVVVTDYVPRTTGLPGSEVSTYLQFDAGLTKALLYDVSNPASPRFLTSIGQSGALVTSRLLDGVLYLVTEYVADPESMSPDDVETYVPVTTKGNGRSPIGAADCIALPYASGPRYVVAGSIDVAARDRIDTEAVLGGSDTVYMSTSNLFLAAHEYDAKLNAAQRKAAGVGDLRASDIGLTHLARIALDKGKLTMGAQTSIPGRVVNQFALDEYEGNLRIAVTVSGETKDRRNWVTRSALYVLDAKLKVVGSLPNLAKNEEVQSVRFDGPVGYVVTFERRDPLFAIDLANPAKPKVMSALKIPGFSTYLDVWADGRLLGLGMDADNNGNVKGMKLSMFDTSDLFDVKELKTTKVAFTDSEALYNHKAVLVDRERALVGFPAMSWNNKGVLSARYLVYAYSQDKGFELQKKLSLSADDQYGTVSGVRGLRIEDYLYVTTGKDVTVYELGSFEKATSVPLS